MKKLLILPFIFSLLACEEEEKSTRLIINHYAQPVTFMGSYFNYLVQENSMIGTDQWNQASRDIVGFEYEWGYVYEIKVKREAIKNSPQDGSDTKTTLLKIVSKEKVSADVQFEIQLSRIYGDGYYENYVYGDPGSGFTLLGEVPIDCGELCDELAKRFTDEDLVAGIFTHADNGLKLVALPR